MSKPLLPSTVAHPSLCNTSNESMKSGYDVLVAKSEQFVTTKGVKGRQRVFSRVSPEQIQADKSGELKKGAIKAKALTREAISKAKIPKAKKETILELMSAPIKGNITSSSGEFLSADQFSLMNKTGKFAALQKQARFADAAPAEIPRPANKTPTLPGEVILPELPPDID